MRGSVGAIAALGIMAALAAMSFASRALGPSRDARSARAVQRAFPTDAPGFRSISAGQEAAIGDAFSSVRARGIGGQALGNVMVHGYVIHVPLIADPARSTPSCALPSWAKPAGGIEVALSANPVAVETAPLLEVVSGVIAVRAHACAAAESRGQLEADARFAAQALSARRIDRVWNLSGHGPVYGGRVWNAGGVVTPVAQAVGVREPVVVLTAWAAAALALAASLWLVRSREPETGASAPADEPQPRGVPSWLRWALGLVVAVGVVLRVDAAATLPLDGDEAWALPHDTSAAASGHEALLHPPLHRGLAQLWAHVVGAPPETSQLLLRLPSIVLGCAVLMLAGLLALRSRSPWSLVPVALVAIAAPLVEVSALARPYGLSVALLALMFLFGDGGATARGLRPLHGAVCVVAAILIAWCDLPAGAAALVVLVSVLAPHARAARAHLGLCAAAYVAGVAPLVPGALVGWSHGPTDFRDAVGLGRMTRAALELAASLAPGRVPFVGLALLVVALAFVWRRGAKLLAFRVASCAVMVVIAASHIAMRDRNVAFFALLPAFAVLAAMLRPMRTAVASSASAEPTSPSSSARVS